MTRHTPVICVQPATRVVKRVAPHQHGALKHAKRFGDRLVCVRYRQDLDATRRYTTVELIVDEAPIATSRRPVTTGKTLQMVVVRLAPHEQALRRAIARHGGLCDPTSGLWYLRLSAARALGVLDRIV